MNTDHKSLETVFSILSPVKTKTINNSVSKDLRSTFVDSINVFDCRLSEVFIEYRPTEYVAKTIRWLLGIIYIFVFLLKKIILFPHRIGAIENSLNNRRKWIRNRYNQCF